MGEAHLGAVITKLKLSPFLSNFATRKEQGLGHIFQNFAKQFVMLRLFPEVVFNCVVSPWAGDS